MQIVKYRKASRKAARPKRRAVSGVQLVATKKEVLRLLGVRRVTLAAIEAAAGIPQAPERPGYTFQELVLLKSALRTISSTKKLS